MKSAGNQLINMELESFYLNNMVQWYTRAAHPSKILSDHALHLTRVSNSIEMPIYADNFILSAL